MIWKCFCKWKIDWKRKLEENKNRKWTTSHPETNGNGVSFGLNARSFSLQSIQPSRTRTTGGRRGRQRTRRRVVRLAPRERASVRWLQTKRLVVCRRLRACAWTTVTHARTTDPPEANDAQLGTQCWTTDRSASYFQILFFSF